MGGDGTPLQVSGEPSPDDIPDDYILGTLADQEIPNAHTRDDLWYRRTFK